MNDGAVRKILTPDQMEKWYQLPAKRSLPRKPPNATRSALSGAELAGVHTFGSSPIFHALATHANALCLSADQKTLLKDLEDVTREGYVWMGRRNLEGSPGPEDTGKHRADRISRVRSEFVKHAEQVALLGYFPATSRNASGRHEGEAAQDDGPKRAEGWVNARSAFACTTLVTSSRTRELLRTQQRTSRH